MRSAIFTLRFLILFLCNLTTEVIGFQPIKSHFFQQNHKVVLAHSKFDSTEQQNGLSLEPLLNSLLDKMSSALQHTSPLRERPGFAFSLGCDEWRNGDYSGRVTGWSSPGKVRWISTSRMDSNINPASTYSSSLLDLTVFVNAALDVPHMRLSIVQNSTSQAVRLKMDYVPREDLLSSLVHYDKYFYTLDSEINQLLHRLKSDNSVRLHSDSETRATVLSRMIASPFALDLIVPTSPSTQHAANTLNELCHSHVDRWCQWMNSDSSNVPATAGTPTRNDRDVHIARLFYEEYKMRFAHAMGADFAPLAEPIAQACMGPA